MSYSAWSVVFGEQPTAAKWNILGSNDASFHDGTGIDDGAILIRHTNHDKVRVEKDGANSQTINHDTQTALTWPAENFDIGGLHSTSVNPSRFTAQKDGKYLHYSNIRWASNTTGIREATLRVGGTPVCVSQVNPNVSSFNPTNNICTIVDLVATNYVETWVYQNSGGGLAVLASSLSDSGLILLA